MSTKIWLDEWVARKRREIAAAEPLSIQTNIAVLSQRLWAAESALDQIGRLHRPDPTGSRCVHDQWAWPCATKKLTTTTERGHR